MVSQLNQAAEETRAGQSPDMDFFKDMFDKISEMTQKKEPLARGRGKK